MRSCAQGIRAIAGGLALVALMAVPASGAPVRFENPPSMVSGNGVLEGTLTAAPAEVQIGNKRATTTVYNGLYSAPVLRVQPGDSIRLRLVDASSLPTNIHTHGLVVSPLGNSDNVFLKIQPGGALDYEINIPADHPSGLYWYHPHFHPDVNPAIAGGLSGALVIGDVLAPFPELRGITERLILLKDLKLRPNGQPVNDPDPAGPTRRTINGLWKPRIEIAPGELQFWRIGNIGANIYYKLRMKGVTFNVIAQDGNLKNQIVPMRTLIIPPGARYEVLVRGPRRHRKIPLKALKFNTGPDGDSYPRQRLATVVVRGPRVPEIPLPTAFPPVPDLRQTAITNQRKIVFADTPDPNVFTIDGKPYDESRVDTTVTLGSVEEWTVTNTSGELHVFHIHQSDFQVTEIDGRAQPFTGYQDTISLPFKKHGRPGQVKFIIPFTNAVSVGEFVYHCHIVQHADQGMMANIQLVDPAQGPLAPLPPATSTPHH